MPTCQDAVRGWVLRQGTVGLSLIAIPNLALAFVDLRPICCPDSLSGEFISLGRKASTRISEGIRKKVWGGMQRAPLMEPMRDLF